MLGPHANAHKPRRDALQPGDGGDEAHHERGLQRPIAGLERGADDVVLDDDLHPLRHLHWKLTAPANGVEYNHLFMGTESYNFRVAGINTRTDDIKQDADLVTARVNYRFGGPVIGKY